MASKPTTSLGLLTTFVKARAKRKVGRMSPMQAFRFYIKNLPEMKSEETAKAFIQSLDNVQELVNELRPAEKNFCERAVNNPIHVAYFCLLALARRRIGSWLLRNELDL